MGDTDKMIMHTNNFPHNRHHIIISRNQVDINLLTAYSLNIGLLMYQIPQFKCEMNLNIIKSVSFIEHFIHINSLGILNAISI